MANISRKKLKSLARSSFVVNVASVTALRAANGLTRIIVLLLIARSLAPAEFGAVIAAFAITEIARVIADFGLSIYAIREITQIAAIDSARQDRFAAESIVVKVVFGVLTYIAIASYYIFLQPHEITLIGLVSGLSIISWLFISFSLSYFQALQLSQRIVIPTALNAVATISGVALLTFLQAYIVVILTFVAICEFAYGVTLWLFLKKPVPLRIHMVSVNRTDIVALVRSCLPLAVTSILVIVYTRFGVVALNWLATEEATGLYGLASRMTEPFQIVAAAMSTVIYGRMSRDFASNRDHADAIALRFILLGVIYGVLVCGLIAISGPIFLMKLLPQYVSALPILTILQFSMVFRSLNFCLTAIIQAKGRFVEIARIATWNMLLISVLQLIFVPIWQAEGAALALIIGELLNSLLQLYVLVRSGVHLNIGRRVRMAQK